MIEELEKKEKKELIKRFTEKLRTIHKVAMEQFYSGLLTADNLRLYIAKAPTVQYEVMRLEKETDQKKQKDAFFAIINREEPIVKQFLQEAENELKILEEQATTLTNTSAFTPEEIKTKKYRFDSLCKRMNFTAKLIEDLRVQNNLVSPNKKSGRPVGAKDKKPRKNKNSKGESESNIIQIK